MLSNQTTNGGQHGTHGNTYRPEDEGLHSLQEAAQAQPVLQGQAHEARPLVVVQGLHEGLRPRVCGAQEGSATVMRGHVRKQGNAWYVVVDLPRDPVTGKRKQKWHSGFRTKRDADKALTDILSRLDQGTYVEPTKQTVSMFFDEWLAATSPTLRASTKATSGTIIKSHVKPHLGSLPLQGLTASRLNALYADLLKKGRRNGKGGLSPATVRYVHAVIRKALSDAVRWNLLTRNVADSADPPRAQRGQIKTRSAREVRTFLKQVEGDRYEAAYFVAATTGMRRGEVLGLKWQDIDFDAARVSIVRALVVVRGLRRRVFRAEDGEGTQVGRAR
jgi:hypothetical protein